MVEAECVEFVGKRAVAMEVEGGKRVAEEASHLLRLHNEWKETNEKPRTSNQQSEKWQIHIFIPIDRSCKICFFKSSPRLGCFQTLKSLLLFKNIKSLSMCIFFQINLLEI